MKTLDEMLHRSLLTHSQHAEISRFVAAARTPEAILAMPEPLWRPRGRGRDGVVVVAEQNQAPAVVFNNCTWGGGGH